VVLSSEEARAAIAEPLQAIIDAVKDTLEETPPELAADISERGILLAGGGALLQGFDERIRQETGMPANLADSPLTCVAVGSGRSLDEFDAIAKSDARAAKRAAQRRASARASVR
jgi:rod shape-determining protein MreB